MNLNECKVTPSGNIRTPVFTLSFPQLFTPEVKDDGSKKFSCSMIFDEDADLTLLEEAVTACWKAKYPELKKSQMKFPFRNGEQKEHFDGYEEGMVYFTASTQRRPSIRTADNTRDITEEEELVYPGARFIASVDTYAYDFKGKGIAIGLNGLQFVGHGDRIDGGGGVDAEEEFDSIEDDDSGLFD